MRMQSRRNDDVEHIMFTELFEIGFRLQFVSTIIIKVHLISWCHSSLFNVTRALQSPPAQATSVDKQETVQWANTCLSLTPSHLHRWASEPTAAMLRLFSPLPLKTAPLSVVSFAASWLTSIMQPEIPWYEVDYNAYHWLGTTDYYWPISIP